MSYANCGLPYYIGEVIKDRNDLFVSSATSFKLRFNADVRTQTEVMSIHPEEKNIVAFDQRTGQTYTESYDKLVLSPGAEPIRPPLDGINNEGIFTLRNVTDTDYIKNYVSHKKVKEAVVIGAGFIGLEMAENLHQLGIAVTVVEMGNQILAPLDYPMAALVQRHIRSKGVSLMLNNSVTGFEKTINGNIVILKNGEHIQSDLVILSIGVKPDTRLALAAGLKIGPSNGIWVNEYLQTSNEHIFAVGDAIEFENPISHQSMPTYLAGPANKQGRICANNLVNGANQAYKGAINTAIVKVFDMTVATEGMASKNLNRVGLEHMVSTNHSGSHAGYYPGAQQMSIQLAFSPKEGTLLGAQIVGFEGVDKRMDILSLMIQAKATVYDLMAFEHAYAPPYSSAKDPVNMAGFVAENILTQKLSVFYWDQVKDISADDILLDVRTVEEFEKGHIANAINIPIDALRNRMAELDANKNIYIYCQAGLRGYLGHRILKQNHYNKVLNLSGGYQIWEACVLEQGMLEAAVLAG